MKQLIFFITILAATIANAQMGVFPKSLDSATPVDTAIYTVTYSLNYAYHPKADARLEDVRTLLIGRSCTKDYSDIIHHFDSLMTIQQKRGASTFSNPPDSPWPYEILLSNRGRHADIRYRLPIGAGTLHYVESVPMMSWHFVPDSTRTLLGFECQLATTEFAGRTYSAWFTSDIPLPYGPYKFGGLPGLILKIQDAEEQFVWEVIALKKSNLPIESVCYEDDKTCSPEEAVKTISRCFKTPIAFQLAALGGGKGRVYVTSKDGKTLDASEINDTPIPYIPIER